MPTDTWVVTSKADGGVADVTATHYNAQDKVDSTFSSRLKVGADSDVDKFVDLAEQQLLADVKKQDDSTDFADSIATKLNA